MGRRPAPGISGWASPAPPARPQSRQRGRGHPRLYNSLDTGLEHRERYTPQGLTASLEEAGFQVASLTDFNRVSVPGWYVNGSLLKRRHFSKVRVKSLELSMLLVRHLDQLLPWTGLGLIGVGVKPHM